jgi:CubicO group peptidase (beta-lactamase class C family)
MDEGFSAWAEAGFSGSVALSTDGEFDCLAAHGSADEAAGTPNTVDTVFAIGSVSKTFTAAAIFSLVDDGEIALDDRVGDLVPELEGPVADATVEQLLLHTSGLSGTFAEDHQPLEREAALQAIGDLELAFEPGADYAYSNAGYTLLAIVIDEVSGGYREYLASEILPLPEGETSAGFWDGDPAASGPRAIGYLDEGPTEQMGDFSGPHWALNGNGDLAMTPQHLAMWTQALFNGEIVSPEAVEILTSPEFDHGNGTQETLGNLGWVDASLLGEPVFMTSGGGGDTGHNATVAWLPESRRAIAITTNTPDVTADELLTAVGPALVAGDPLPAPDVTPGDVDPADVADIVGTYELATGGSLEVTAAEGRLAVAADGADAAGALFPPSDGFSVADVEQHEDRVLALLAGESQEGQEELEALESDVGPIDAVELVGTVVEDAELHTYVTVTSGDVSERLWYALDDQGGIAAAMLGVDPPTLELVPSDSNAKGASGDASYRPDDPTGAGPDVTVTFGADAMTIVGPDGSTEAQLAG